MFVDLIITIIIIEILNDINQPLTKFFVTLILSPDICKFIPVKVHQTCVNSQQNGHNV